MSVTAVPLQPVKRGYLVWLWLGILIAVGGAFLLAWQGTRNPTAEFLASNAARPEVKATATGLQIETLTPGKDDNRPTDSDVVLINYEGKLLDGSTFDKSQQPTPMPVRGVVPGFSEALKLMSRGGKYRLWIKPELGYGAEEKKGPDGKVVIPANSVLVFDVELIDFIPEAVLQQLQQQQQGGMPGGIPGVPGGPGGPGEPGGAPGQ